MNIAAAKARLSELVERAAQGETIEISRRGVVLAKLVPAAEPANKPFDWMALWEKIKDQPLTGDSVEIIRAERDAGY